MAAFFFFLGGGGGGGGGASRSTWLGARLKFRVSGLWFRAKPCLILRDLYLAKNTVSLGMGDLFFCVVWVLRNWSDGADQAYGADRVP